MEMRRGYVVLLTTVMTAGILAGCGGGADVKKAEVKEDKTISTSGFPIVKEPITLKVFAGKSPSAPNDWNNVEVWKEYAKMSNINIDWQLVPTESLAEKRNLTLAGGDLPDAFHTSRFSAEDLLNYGGQGLFIPLNDLIKKYAPNFQKMMDQYPEIKKAITMTDGKIYSLPSFYDPSFMSVRTGSQLWLNKKYLDTMNMKEPTTTEEFYQYLKAIKTKDPNGNGKNDEIPYAASGYAALLDHLKGSWGLGNRGLAHSRVDVDPTTNKLRFIPMDGRYKELLEYMNKLYKEDLFVKDILTLPGPEFLAKGKEGNYGSFMYTNAKVGFNVQQNDYIGALAFTGPHGDRLFSRARPSVQDVGSFVITKNNKNPEASLRWVDYFYSEEGSKMFFLGFEGKSFVMKNGKAEYADEIKQNQENLKKYVTFMGGYYPAMLTEKTFTGGESDPDNIAATKKNEAYWPKDVWGPFKYTAEELPRFNALSADINNYVNEMTTKFIMGAASFSEWDTYTATLKKMGIEEYLKIYTAAADRYNKP
jgi:putative aldouronate transport system substrate-binding protein